jgi:hypothetical protein
MNEQQKEIVRRNIQLNNFLASNRTLQESSTSLTSNSINCLNLLEQRRRNLQKRINVAEKKLFQHSKLEHVLSNDDMMIRPHVRKLHLYASTIKPQSHHSTENCCPVDDPTKATFVAEEFIKQLSNSVNTSMATKVTTNVASEEAPSLKGLDNALNILTKQCKNFREETKIIEKHAQEILNKVDQTKSVQTLSAEQEMDGLRAAVEYLEHLVESWPSSTSGGSNLCTVSQQNITWNDNLALANKCKELALTVSEFINSTWKKMFPFIRNRLSQTIDLLQSELKKIPNIVVDPDSDPDFVVTRGRELASVQQCMESIDLNVNVRSLEGLCLDLDLYQQKLGSIRALAEINEAWSSHASKESISLTSRDSEKILNEIKRRSSVLLNSLNDDMVKTADENLDLYEIALKTEKSAARMSRDRHCA